MSCAEVMYQPYAPYFPYHHQRTADTDHYRKFSAAAAAAAATIKSHAAEETIVSEPHTSSSPPAAIKEGAKDAQYLSANCVLFTYYSGDISTVVDEHFARALSQTYAPVTDPKTTNKDGPPMSHRNFPASFWNSNYQPTGGPGPMGPASLGALPDPLNPYGGDPYHHASLQNDLWHYGGPHYHTRGPHDPLAPYPSPRFAPQLLLPRSRLGPAAACSSLEKSEAWSASRYHHHDPLGHMDANYGSAYSSMAPMPGLEGQPQESKEIYWF